MKRKVLALPMWVGSFQVALWRGWECDKQETSNPPSRAGAGASHTPFVQGFKHMKSFYQASPTPEAGKVPRYPI